MRYINTIDKNEWDATAPGNDINQLPNGVLASPDDNPFFTGWDIETHRIVWAGNELPTLTLLNQSELDDIAAGKQLLIDLETAYANKMAGVDYGGVMCSATSVDQDGLAAMYIHVKLEGNSTIFYFDNGNSLPLNPAMFDAFYSAWTTFRQTFFVA